MASVDAAERSGAVPGGLVWLCVEERYPLLCWMRGKRVNVGGGGDTVGVGAERGHTARTCCAGRSPSTERPLPCRLHMHMHDRTRLHRRRPALALACSALSVGGDGDEQNQSALGALVIGGSKRAIDRCVDVGTVKRPSWHRSSRSSARLRSYAVLPPPTQYNAQKHH